MKNKKVTITSTLLNTAVDKATEVVITAEESYTTSGGENKILYPTGIYFKNNSGANLLYNILYNSNEESEYDADQTLFDPIPLESGETLNISKGLNRCYTLVLRKEVGDTVSSNVDIYFINYI